eukprot:9652073-Alexandrium_andersonii.AAC.1
MRTRAHRAREHAVAQDSPHLGASSGAPLAMGSLGWEQCVWRWRRRLNMYIMDGASNFTPWR